MANQTIPNLPNALPLGGTEQFWAVQNGEDVNVTALQIATYLASNPAIMNAAIASYLSGLPTTLPGISGQPYWDGGLLAKS